MWLFKVCQKVLALQKEREKIIDSQYYKPYMVSSD